MVSRDKDIRKLVEKTLESDDWSLEDSCRVHSKLVHKGSRQKIPIPFSPSDGRAMKNLKSRIAQVQRGRFIYKGNNDV